MPGHYHPSVSPWLREQLDRVRAKPKLKVFALSITDRCNIQCDFCCHPFMDSEIPAPDAERMVEEAVLEDFDEICVTGGEPMLRRELVYALARRARAGNVMFGFISNGYWAKSPERARAEINKLAEAGVSRMTISWDPSHGAFVPPERAMCAIDAAMDAGLKVTLVGSFKDREMRHRDFGFDTAAHEQYDNFRLVNHAVSPAGNGSDLGLPMWDGRDTDFIKHPEIALRCPSSSIQELVVFSRGGLAQPCCSIYAGYKARHLAVGDWRTASVAELNARHEADGYFRVIRSGGFNRVYELVREADPALYATLPDPASASDACSLCAKIMNAPIGPAIRAICEATVTRKIDSLLDDLFGPDLAARPEKENTPA